jgi:alkaline phosphatase
MKSGPGRFFVHVLMTLGVLVLALFVFSRFSGQEVAIGNLVLRSQKGVTHPLATPQPFHPQLWVPAAGGGSAPTPRNVVLFIGDGMGVGQVSAAADLLERPGGTLAMMDTPFVGLVRTWAADTLITDSAASATSLATGYKTDKKMVSVLPDGSIPLTLFEAADRKGMRTGVITTSGLVDATPACFTTHVAHRDNYEEILEQMFESKSSLLIGGDFLLRDKAQRNRDYLELESMAEQLASAEGFHFIRDPDSLASAELPILALFPGRKGFTEQHGPQLAISTQRAVELMLAEDKPFLLVVESEFTDSLAHSNDIEGLMHGIRELDEAVAGVLDLVEDRGDTLVVVTADHDTGGLSLVDGDYEDNEVVARWSTFEHTSQWVPLFAFGPGAEAFTEVLDNTEVAVRIAQALGLQPFPELTEFDGN